jgi:hypothetical protein
VARPCSAVARASDATSRKVTGSSPGLLHRGRRRRTGAPVQIREDVGDTVDVAGVAVGEEPQAAADDQSEHQAKHAETDQRRRSLGRRGGAVPVLRSGVVVLALSTRAPVYQPTRTKVRTVGGRVRPLQLLGVRSRAARPARPFRLPELSLVGAVDGPAQYHGTGDGEQHPDHHGGPHPAHLCLLVSTYPRVTTAQAGERTRHPACEDVGHCGIRDEPVMVRTGG